MNCLIATRRQTVNEFYLQFGRVLVSQSIIGVETIWFIVRHGMNESIFRAKVSFAWAFIPRLNK